MPVPALEIDGVRFGWTSESPLLDIPSLELEQGERLFLRGPSGSGKSTLLGLIAGVITPQSGAIKVLGEDITQLGASARDRMRSDHLGVIFQMFNLLPFLSVVANVALPCRFSHRRRTRVGGPVNAEARRLLASLGLAEAALLGRRARDLSVGQQQRVAAARALIGGPEIIIADEPTSALDADTRDRFIELLSAEVAESGASLIFVSHDATLAHHFDKSLDLRQLNTAAAAAA